MITPLSFTTRRCTEAQGGECPKGFRDDYLVSWEWTCVNSEAIAVLPPRRGEGTRGARCRGRAAGTATRSCSRAGTMLRGNRGRAAGERQALQILPPNLQCRLTNCSVFCFLLG